MEQELRAYVNALFEQAPNSSRTIEVREEIYANVLERYNDLLKSGTPPAQAYELAKSSIGNIQDIFQSLQEPATTDLEAQKMRKHRSIFLSIGMGCWVLAGGSIAIFSMFGLVPVGLILMFVFAAIALAFTVYAATAYKNSPASQYAGVPNDEVEQFQQWKAEKISGERRSKRYSGPFWLLVTVVYFLVSFSTGAWQITWLIWIIGAAVEKLIEVAVAP